MKKKSNSDRRVHVAEKLHIKIKQKLEEKEAYSFTDYIDDAREKILEEGRQTFQIISLHF